jgi:hypothetical protein
MEQCGQELTRECTVEQLRQTRDFDTQGLSGAISFDNDKQLSGTAIAVYQLNAADRTFKALTDFVEY